MVDDGGEIQAMVTTFYSALFSFSPGTRYEELLQHVPSRVTEAMNDELTRDYTEEEIKTALDSMRDLKAPGPDGMPGECQPYSPRNFGILWGRMWSRRSPRY